MKCIPRTYQDMATKWMLTTDKGVVSADCGLGKTLIVFNWLEMQQLLHGETRTLILVPKRVLDTGVWPDEARKWDHLAGLRVDTVTGTPAQRLKIIEDGAPVQVINFELIPWLLEHYYGNWPWQVLIIDELTKLKASSGTWFKGKPKRKVEDADGKITTLPATPGIKHAAKKCQHVFGLTGTLLSRGIGDLWAQIFLIDQGERLGANITAFRQRWMRQGYDGYSWEALPFAEEQVTELIKDIVLTIRSEDYLDLPPTITNTLPVHLDDKVMKQYRALEKEFFIQIEGNTVEAVNAAVLSGKVRQFASGFLYTNEDATEWETIHTGKLEALQAFLDDTSSPVIVCYQYKAELDLLLNNIKGAVRFDGKPEVKQRFMSGTIPVLLLHPGSGGHGVDGLQQSCNHIVWYSLTWSLDDYQQANERIGGARQVSAGKTDPVFVHHLIAQGTIDHAMLERLTTHCSVQDAIRNSMKKGMV